MNYWKKFYEMLILETFTSETIGNIYYRHPKHIFNEFHDSQSHDNMIRTVKKLEASKRSHNRGYINIDLSQAQTRVGHNKNKTTNHVLKIKRLKFRFINQFFQLRNKQCFY